MEVCWSGVSVESDDSEHNGSMLEWSQGRAFVRVGWGC